MFPLLLRSRRPLFITCALLVGAFLFSSSIFLIAPLAWIENSPRVIAARAELAADLAKYRASPIDFRELKTLRWGAVAYEDRSYFDRPSWMPPLSVKGVVRAIGRNLRGIKEGGSTIPAQVAKLYLRESASAGVTDKATELAFATWMVREVPPEEILGLYLNLSASRALGQRDPAAGLARLSLAMFGLPLERLDAQDQLLIASTPRGIRWLRSHPVLSLSRVSSAKEWLLETGRWPGPPKEEEAAPGASFEFVSGWREIVASGKTKAPDVDVALAIDSFREGVRKEIDERFPTASVQAAFAVIGADGTVVARSGSESATMRLNYGSIAKLEPLALAVETFGPDGVRNFQLPPAACVRWFWSGSRTGQLGRFCPTDVAEPAGPMAIDRAVAQSINTMTVRHVAVLPYRIWAEKQALFEEIVRYTSASEKRALFSDADRAISANVLQTMGFSMMPEDVGEELSYSALQVSLFRYLNHRRSKAGLPADRLPEDPTQSLGNSSRATLEQIGAYVHGKAFAAYAGECAFSEVGALLANERKEGTLRWLASKRPKLVFAGKTGTSPHDDSAIAAVALCLDGRPVVIAAGVRPIEGKLPYGFRGSVLLRGIDSYLSALADLERTVSGPALPEWMVPPEPLAELAP